jgi:hypothetical protein
MLTSRARRSTLDRDAGSVLTVPSPFFVGLFGSPSPRLDNGHLTRDFASWGRLARTSHQRIIRTLHLLSRETPP